MMRRAAADVTGRTLGHVPALDGIRAVAALAVVGFHARIAGFGNGDIGVDVFFALSGFLITSILLSRGGPSGRIRYGDFYRRRALRLLPAYFAVVIVCVLLEAFLDYGGTFKGAVVSSVYAANWAVAATGTGLGTLAHTWSLSIEEQFYLVWPVLLALLLRRSRGNGGSVLLAVGALVVASWLIVAGLAAAHEPARIASNATPARAVELLIGALLAVFVAAPGLSGPMSPCRRASLPSIAGVTALLALLALVPLSGLGVTIDTVLLWPVIAALTCTVIYAALRGASLLTAPLGSRAMTAIGKRSYGLYLWHFPVLVIIDTRWGLESWTAKIAGLAVTAVVVALSYRFIERPFLARKDARRLAVEATPVPVEAAPQMAQA